ncbi:iron export ABC transporter permease subunit FetB [Atopobium sp. oral taxon 416]|uniref:ABC transporter permease n=1 Tax=Atopobium sp. oral taxon 416 TaxID=712157 RepID=UPI001BA991DE|nr:iron export ABC transporter permease subunit FetB [Atopobium sp. oral taxon 416]QUC02931.1 iron export ABC transporter permease subunit FetB [Atopobium sp. oral taxon 416]
MQQAGVIDIGYLELILAAGFMLVAAYVSWRMKLGQEKSIAIATVRVFLQLLAMGFILIYIFQYQSWWLVLLVMFCMSLFAARIACDRIKLHLDGLWIDVYASITLSSVVIALIVVEGIIHATPWYSARQLIPITGMAMGNTLSAVALATSRLFADLDSRSDEIFALVALGATPQEAAMPSIRSAVGAGIMPTIAGMSAAGIVQIPGMMSGQILAGADPVTAAKYQIVVLLMMSAATTLAIVMACFLTYRKRFSESGYYLDPGMRAKQS